MRIVGIAADLDQPPGARTTSRRRGRDRPVLQRVIRRLQRVHAQQVLDVGEDQLLVLLLVVEPEAR